MCFWENTGLELYDIDQVEQEHNLVDQNLRNCALRQEQETESDAHRKTDQRVGKLVYGPRPQFVCDCAKKCLVFWIIQLLFSFVMSYDEEKHHWLHCIDYQEEDSQCCCVFVTCRLPEMSLHMDQAWKYKTDLACQQKFEELVPE